MRIKTYDILGSYLNAHRRESITLTARVPKWVNEALELLARELGISKSELIREAISEYVVNADVPKTMSSKPDTQELHQNRVIYV